MALSFQSFAYEETPPASVFFTSLPTQCHKQFPLPLTKVLEKTNGQTNKNKQKQNKQMNKRKLLNPPKSSDSLDHKVKTNNKQTCNDLDPNSIFLLVNIHIYHEERREGGVTWMREAITCLISMSESFQCCCCLNRSTPISCTTCDGVGGV